MGKKSSGKTWTAILTASGQKQQLTVVQQWQEWLATVADGKLRTIKRLKNQKKRFPHVMKIGT